MLKKFVLPFILILLTAVSVNAQGDIPVGAIFDLSGVTRDVGTPYAEGVRAYIDFVNTNGGIGGRQIALLGGDAGGLPASAEQLYTQLAAQGAVLIMGWGTTDTAALVSRAANDGIPMLSAAYSDSFNDPFGQAPFNFVVAPSYGDQITILLAHMAELWTSGGGRTTDMNVAIFYDDSDFGMDPLRTGIDAASSLRIGGVLPIKMPQRAGDFTTELQQADDYGVTHIIIQSMPASAALLARNIESFFGRGSVQIGCLNWCADEQFIGLAGTAAEGALGVQPFTPISARASGHEDIRNFVAGRAVAFDTLSVHFVQGWTMAAVAVEAISTTIQAGLPLTGANVRAALETFDEFETGDLLHPVTFSAEDHVGTRASTVYVVRSGQWVASSDVIDLR